MSILKKIQKFFGLGCISLKKNGSCRYSVQSVKDLAVIINHFDKYPLITQKYADYLLFKKAVNLVKNKKHLTLDGLREVVAIKASMNKGLSPSIKAAFVNIIPVNRPSVFKEKIRDDNWISGFTTGDGSFIIRIIQESSRRLGFKVQLIFKIGQHIREEKLIRSLVDHLACGKVSIYKNVVYFEVTKFTELYYKIIPFFKKNFLHGVKQQDYLYFVSILELMNDKKHLTEEGLDQIRRIALGMHKEIVSNDNSAARLEEINRSQASSKSVLKSNQEIITWRPAPGSSPKGVRSYGILANFPHGFNYRYYYENLKNFSAYTTDISKVSSTELSTMVSLPETSYKRKLSSNLASYLAGLIEGKGYIGIKGIKSKIKVIYRPKIIIAFNINDKPLAEKLSAELKVGKIINREKSGIVLWQILAKEEVLKIINFINGNMRTPKIEALHRAIRWINERDGTSIPCLGLDSSPLESNSWLAGFIDASKSSVGFYLIKQNTRKSVKFIPQFKLEDNLIFSNNENGELINIAYFSILSKISEFFKTSLISRTEHSKYLRLSIKIVVRNSFSLEIIIAYFTKFPLLGKKGCGLSILERIDIKSRKKRI